MRPFGKEPNNKSSQQTEANEKWHRTITTWVVFVFRFQFFFGFILLFFLFLGLVSSGRNIRRFSCFLIRPATRNRELVRLRQTKLLKILNFNFLGWMFVRVSSHRRQYTQALRGILLTLGVDSLNIRNKLKLT